MEYVFGAILFLCFTENILIVGSKEADACFYNSTIIVSNRQKCLEELKHLAADSSLYWFGERWRTTCSVRLNLANTINCYNPPKFQRYESVGARLLRVPTFDLAYLKNLEFLPRMTFVSEPGEYIGCDHAFRSEWKQEINVYPKMSASPPWHLRTMPFIDWAEMERSNDLYTVVIVDVGFGDLFYLAYNYPTETKTVKEYSGPINFRELVNPVALLIFRQFSGKLHHLEWKSALQDDSTFNVQEFMLKNSFQQSLVGLNWINVGTDGFAIEEQRKRSVIDNCPLLLRSKLYSPLDGIRLKFLPDTAVRNLDTWVTVMFRPKAITFSVCCKQYSYDSSDLKLDPLGDKELRPVFTRSSPIVSAARFVPSESDLYNYRRMSRDFVAVGDSSYYTLLFLDVDHVQSNRKVDDRSPLALWLVTDIPGNMLTNFSEGSSGITVLPYLAPLPNDDRLHRYVFLLFRQEDGPTNAYHNEYYSPKDCQSYFTGRCSFDVQELMARNSLTLRALNWMLSRQDEYVRYNSVLSGRDEKITCKNHGGYIEKCKPQAEHHRRSHPSPAYSAANNIFGPHFIVSSIFWTTLWHMLTWQYN